MRKRSNFNLGQHTTEGTMEPQMFRYQLDSGTYLEFQTRDDVFNPTGTTSELIKAVSQHMQGPKPRTVLDLGCGSGIVGVVLHKMGLVSPPLFASDASASAVDLTQENCHMHDCPVVTKKGSIFDPWEGQKFDYIVNDISGVAQAVAEVSPWFRDIPCASGPDGTELVIEVLRSAPKYLNEGGTLFFPVLSLSDADKIVSTATKTFSKVQKLSHKKWPLTDDMKASVPLLKDLALKGKIQIEEKFGMVLWYTDIYAVSKEYMK